MLNSYFPLAWAQNQLQKNHFYFVYERREVAEKSNIYCNMARPSSLYNDLHQPWCFTANLYYVSIKGQSWFSVSMQSKVSKVTLQLLDSVSSSKVVFLLSGHLMVSMLQ